jgi:hypothetical protein
MDAGPLRIGRQLANLRLSSLRTGCSEGGIPRVNAILRIPIPEPLKQYYKSMRGFARALHILYLRTELSADEGFGRMWLR